MADIKKRYSVLFGFHGADDQDTTGYLKIEENGMRGNCGGIYSIVKTVEQATKFPRMNYDQKQGFWSPDRIAEFMLLEDELAPWVFHPVPIKGFSEKVEPTTSEDEEEPAHHDEDDEMDGFFT